VTIAQVQPFAGVNPFLATVKHGGGDPNSKRKRNNF